MLSSLDGQAVWLVRITVGMCLLGVCAVAVTASVSLLVVHSVVCHADTTAADYDETCIRMISLAETTPPFCCRSDLTGAVSP